MKKVTMFLLAVLLIASLFVSCDTNTNAVLDEHVTVSFSTGSDGRSLGYEIENITNLKWHYSARKASSEDPFKYGETSDTILANFSTQIELSQGKWNFKLWANKVEESGREGDKVYEGSVSGVLITKETSPKSIVIDVSPNVSDVNGSIKFEGVQVSLKGTNTDTSVYAKTATISGVNGDISLENGTATKSGLTPGDYVVTVKYTERVDETTTVTYASETIIVTVWSGRTTTISGNVSEETGSAIIDGNVQVPTQATVTKTAASGQTTVFTANVAPANNGESSKMESTTAVFEADALDNNASYSLSVAVTNDVENGNINIGSTSGIAATLNLSLKNGATDVSTFNGKTVTITTYIAKGLGNNNVSVTGPSEANISGVSYDSDTGKLVFTTNHFSEYKVIVNGDASYEAYNVTTSTAYQTLTNAISSIEEKGTIVVIKDLISTGKIVFPEAKNITLDLNGHTVKTNGDSRGFWANVEGELTLKGSGYIGDDTHESVGYLFYLLGTLTIEGDMTIESGLTCVQLSSANAKLYVHGGRWIGDEWNNVYWTINAIDAYRDSSICIIDGGSFYKFNPGDTNTESPRQNWVADGYGVKSINSNGYYEVIKAEARIGENYYEKLVDAFTGLPTGSNTTITLLSNVVLTSPLSINQDIILEGDGYATISGQPVSVGSAANVTFRNVNFATPDNANHNASSVYASGLEGKVVFDGCTFTNPQWECIQITPMDGAEIVVKNCTFIADGNATYAHGTKVERLLHIQNTAASGKYTATITNNRFIGVDLCRNSVIDIDDIEAFANVTCGGNTFANHDGTDVSTLADGMIYININGLYDEANVATDTYAQFTQTPAATLQHSMVTMRIMN